MFIFKIFFLIIFIYFIFYLFIYMFILKIPKVKESKSIFFSSIKKMENTLLFSSSLNTIVIYVI